MIPSDPTARNGQATRLISDTTAGTIISGVAADQTGRDGQVPIVIEDSPATVIGGISRDRRIRNRDRPFVTVETASITLGIIATDRAARDRDVTVGTIDTTAVITSLGHFVVDDMRVGDRDIAGILAEDTCTITVGIIS